MLSWGKGYDPTMAYVWASQDASTSRNGFLTER
jgi:hypothetical protein